MKKRIIKYFYSSLFALSLTLSLEANMDKVNEYWEKAAASLKVKFKGNQEAVVYLRKAKELMLKMGELTREQDALLVKINTHIYWQNKFSTVNDVNNSTFKEPKEKEEVARTRTTPKKPSTTERKAIAKKTTLLLSEFDRLMAEAEKYEKNHKNDYYSNLLNYLDLQNKAVRLEDAERVFEKTTYFYNSLEKEKAAQLEKFKSNCHNYDKMLREKDYNSIISSLKSYIGLKSVQKNPKDKAYFINLYVELSAMNQMKRNLTEYGSNKRIPVPRTMSEREAFVTSISDKMVFYSTLDGSIKNSGMSWSTVSEKDLMQMAKSLMEIEKEIDLATLAICNMRLGNFGEAYSNFDELTEESATNYNKYKSYMGECVVGFRFNVGKKIEDQLKGALELSKSGKHNKAISSLMLIYENYISKSSLGKNFMGRFDVVYNEIVNKS